VLGLELVLGEGKEILRVTAPLASPPTTPPTTTTTPTTKGEA